MALAKNVVTLTLLADGIPIVYQGQEQHENGTLKGNTNREALWEAGYDTESPLYLQIKTLNAIRHHAIQTSFNYSTFPQYAIYNDAGTLALRKGNDGSQVITILTTDGDSGEKRDFKLAGHGYNASVTEIFTCEEHTIGDDGIITIPMEAGEPKVLYPSDLLYGSGLCDYADEVPEDVPYPQQTTIATSYPTTVSGKAGTYSTSQVSPLPGAFQTQEASSDDTDGDGDVDDDDNDDASETGGFQPDESASAAGTLASSTLAMVVLVLVLCLL
jgi:alpha-amylase